MNLLVFIIIIHNLPVSLLIQVSILIMQQLQEHGLVG